jgi:signal transduction histidine kinase/ActR/RegA family two-component response regulator
MGYMIDGTPGEVGEEGLPDDSWKVQLIDRIYRVAAVVAILPLVIGIYTSLPGNQYFTIALYVSGYVVCIYCAFNRQIHYKLRALFLLSLVFSIGAAELYNESFAADGSLYLFVCVLITGIVFGRRWGFLVIFLSILMYVVSAVHWLSNVENPPSNVGLMPVSPVIWFAAALNFTFLVTILMTVLDLVLRRLEKTLGQSHSLVGHLEKEIDERKRGEQERQGLERQLRQTQRLEAVGQLAGGVAHDFNNLLQAILGYGDLALDKVSKDSPVHRDLTQVLKASDQAKVLVRQLLAFSRQQVLELTDVDLDVVIFDLIMMIRPVIGPHISLDYVPGSNGAIVRADRGQIDQILMNLCVNARDAMSGGGTLTIESSIAGFSESDCEKHSWASPGRYVAFSVADTGCGMDTATQELVFEPFFTTKKHGKGTGLGLSTVFGIVHQHKGFVHLDSEPGVGTTFRVYLPLATMLEPEIKKKESAPLQRGSATILLADDDELVCNVAEAILSDAGYKVLRANDGEEAIQLFDEHADLIDLALLDVVMPKLSGKDVMEHINKHRPAMPVIFCSGYSRETISSDYLLDGGIDLIQKPYHREVLLQAVSDTLKKQDSEGVE